MNTIVFLSITFFRNHTKLSLAMVYFYLKKTFLKNRGRLNLTFSLILTFFLFGKISTSTAQSSFQSNNNNIFTKEDWNNKFSEPIAVINISDYHKREISQKDIKSEISQNIKSTAFAAIIDSSSNYNTFGVSCYGESDGWIQVSGTGGTPPYSYVWDHGPTTSLVTGLSEGYYGVNIFDVNSVFVGNTGMFINQPTDLATLTQIDLAYYGYATSCTGATDAKAWAYSWNGAISATTGVAPYVYTWSNGYIGDTLNNVGAGTYTVTTTDANGCSVVNTIDIIDPPAKTITINEDTPISCEGGSNGMVTAIVNNGNGSETFLWSNGATTANVTGLSAGTYTVTATDANSCETIETINLADGPILDVIFGITPPSCGGSDGQLIAIPTGGNPPYVSYDWNTGASGNTISGLSEGIYTVTVYDNVGCSAEVSHELINANIFYTNLDTTNISGTPCPGASATCTYSYNGGSCSNVTVNAGEIFCVNSGTYTCNVTFNGGTVYVAAGATFSPNWTNNFSGTIINCGTVNFHTGLFDNNSDIQNYGSMYFPNATLNNTTITNYFGASIYINSSVILNQPTTINNFGSIELNGTLTFHNGLLNNYFDIFLNQNFIISNTTSELNNFGRIVAQRDITINSGARIVNECSLIALRDIAINMGFTNNGLVYANGNGSLIRINSSATFVNNGEIITQSLVNNGTIEGSGNFWTFTFTQQNGSSIGADENGLNFYDATFDQNGNGNIIFDVESGTIGATVTRNPPTGPFPDVNTIPDGCDTRFKGIICPGTTLANINTKILGGTAPFTYAWSTGATTSNLTDVSPGTYTLTVTDANTCKQLINATVSAFDSIIIDSVITQIDCYGNDGEIDLTITGGIAPYTYAWAHGPTTEDLTNLTAGTYSVIITDGNCAVEASFSIVEPICIEICDDGVDNDGDGLVDCDEPTCIPVANPALLTTCDNSNETGSGTFFLHDANNTVTSVSGMSISYHPNLADAQNDVNILISPYTSFDGTVYARVENTLSGCYATSLITINVGAKCVESCVNNLDDDGDGLIDQQDSECPCNGN